MRNLKSKRSEIASTQEKKSFGQECFSIKKIEIEIEKNPINFFPSFLLSGDLALISVNGPVDQTDGSSKIGYKVPNWFVYLFIYLFIHLLN